MQSRYDCWVNHNLEAMAKQLYDYWFVQFDFPDENGKPYKSSGGKMVWNEKLKREIPEGWEVKSIFEAISVQYGFPFSTEQFTEERTNVQVVRIRDILEGTTSAYSLEDTDEKYRLNEGDVLVGMDGNFHINFWHNNEAYLNQRCVRLRPYSDSDISSIQILHSISPYIKAKEQNAKGSTVGHLSDKDLKGLNLVQSINTMHFNSRKTLDGLLSLIIRNKKEILSLTKLRDSLLPLLMNGQVSVNYDLLFCPFAHFLYNATKKPMKEEIKTRIITAMAQNLSSEQMALLNIVLCDSFKNIEIIALGDEVAQRNKANNELLNAFISAKKIEGCSDKTLHYYRSSIEALLVKLNKKIDVIVTNDIRNYLSDYQEERLSSRVTIDNLRRIFSSFFAWLEDEDYIGKSPVRRIHKVRTESLVKEVLSDENMEVLRDTCHEIRDLAMIDLLASTGMRVGELAKMNREDIDFQERQCVVFGKGNKEREVYFNARTKIHLKRYLESRKDNNPALFVSLSSPHNRLTISGVEVRLRQLGRKAGISKVHPHKFRRTLATMAIDKGMPIEQVQKLLGHVKIDTTLHYAMVNQTNVKIAHRKFIG